LRPAYLTDYDHGVTAVDTGYHRPLFDASHLIVHDGRAAFVDCGANSSVPRLLQALEATGLSRDCVDYLFLTHIHLDHAGGAGLLARELPGMQVVVHPRGAAHLAAPEKLIAGVMAVYGEEYYREQYGELLPVPAERIVATGDGQRLTLAGREFEFLHTPGHAGHHHCIVDATSRGVFTGDTFGLSYRDFDVEGRPFVMATTTPVQFDPEAMKASLARIVATQPDWLYLTHFGRVGEVARLRRDLEADIDALCACMRAAAAVEPAGPARTAWLERQLLAHLHARLDAHGDRTAREQREAILSMDVQLNAQGLEIWFERQSR
jgi:glyoxylase-like metal-dependent hydrolase (beta-lactamase superfamily II)